MLARLIIATIALILCTVVAIALWLLWTSDGDSGGRRGGGPQVVPVAVASVVSGPIAERRTFSGTIESPSAFTVRPKVSGRVQRMLVEVGDSVERGQVVAELDDDEFREAEQRAMAELTSSQARLREQAQRLTLAQRSFTRVQGLQEERLTGVAELERAEAEKLTAAAAHEVALVEVDNAESRLRSARLNRAHSRVIALWPADEANPERDHARTVTSRHREPGDSVAVGDALVGIATLDPLLAVFSVTERDYPRLRRGQEVSVRSDSFPDQSFRGVVHRLAPTFDTMSRLARVEVTVDNEDGLLRPGMFARLEVVLAQAAEATLVPATAVVRRDGGPVVFVIDEEGGDGGLQARQVAVELGLRDGSWVQVLSAEVAGRVVTLGQQMLSDGSAVRIPEARPGASP